MISFLIELELQTNFTYSKLRMNSTIFPKVDVCLPKDCFIMVMSSCIIPFTACHVINFPLIWDNKSAEK